jgi:hypothetical protein
MLFNKSKSRNNRSNLNYLKLIKYWHRPIGGLNEVISCMEKKSVKDPTLLDKRYIELYAGSLLGMALQKSEGLEFWIAKPENDPPDFVFMTMRFDHKNRIYFRSREVEITRHISEEVSLFERILKKDKPYPKDYILVCFVEITGCSKSLKKIAKKLKEKLVHIEHVFLVFHGIIISGLKNISTEEISRKVSVVQLLPQYDYQTIDIQEEMTTGSKDKKRLAYVEGAEVYYGLRKEDVNFPMIIK